MAATYIFYNYRKAKGHGRERNHFQEPFTHKIVFRTREIGTKNVYKAE